MLKEALQYILDGMRPEIQNLCGRAYVITHSGAQEVIETPIAPDTVPLHSLDSIVKMIRTEAINLADVNTPALFVNIPSPTNVVCFSQPDYEQRCHRTVYYSADATDVPGWDAKVTLGFEEAQIALRTRFQETGDSLYANQRIAVKGVSFDDLTLADWQAAQLGQIEAPFTAEDYTVMDS